MPFDAGYHLRGLIDYVANRSHLGTVLTNPIWIGLIIVAVIVLLLLAVGWEGCPTFKLIFWMCVAVTSLMLVHDTLVHKKADDTHENTAGETLVKDVQQLSAVPDADIGPRLDPDARPQNYDVTLDDLEQAVNS